MSDREKASGPKVAARGGTGKVLRVAFTVPELCGIHALVETGFYGVNSEEAVERIVARWLEEQPDLMAEVRRRYAGARP